MFDLEGKRIWVAGARGMAGSAIARALAARGIPALPDPAREVLDLRRQADVEGWINTIKPDLIFVAAARVGGIADNAAHPADFIADNLQIETNIMTAAAKARVRKLVFLGSSCIYPANAPQPLREDSLMTGPLEGTNRAYAMAKLAGIEMARAYRAQYGCDFVSVLPCNLYGPNDTYDATRSHVIPALIMKLRNAMATGSPKLMVWGTGNPLREFMHVDDLADAVLHVAQYYSDAAPINIGTGQTTNIRALARMLCNIAGYEGAIVYDTSKPDGVACKVLDITRLQDLSWQHRISLEQGLRSVWQQYLQQHPLSLLQHPQPFQQQPSQRQTQR